MKDILVIGDVMLDEYWFGETTRLSPEAPVAVINNVKRTYSLGGAGNVAALICNYGHKTHLYGDLGDSGVDDMLEWLITSKHGINNLCFKSPFETTTHKIRIYANGHYMSRVDSESTAPRIVDLEEISGVIPNIVVLSDYGKGVLYNPQYFIEHFNHLQIPVICDPKQPFSAYRGAYLIKPNRKEFEQYVGNFSTMSELKELACNNMQRNQISNMVVTMGSQGLAYITQEGEFTHIPAALVNVVDVTGAGDTVMASLADSIVRGEPLIVGCVKAVQAAGQTVSVVGTNI